MSKRYWRKHIIPTQQYNIFLLYHPNTKPLVISLLENLHYNWCFYL